MRTVLKQNKLKKTKLKTSISVYLWRQTTPFIKSYPEDLWRRVHLSKKKEYKNNLMYLEGYVMS